MKGNCDFIPESPIVKSNGIFQIMYDFVPVEREGRTSYDFSYAEVTAVERGKIISAIIRDSYPEDSEIALINNHLIDYKPEEYEAYTALRLKAKQVANEVLGS